MEENEFSPKIDINEEELLGKAKPPKYLKALLIISLIIIVLLIGVIIYLLFFNKKEEKSKDEPEPQYPSYDTYHFFGTKYSNLPYDENGIITNTFKKGGENFNEEIGNINEGENYKSNELNIYDLYIPRYAENRKNETNGIMLWIHGGWWIGGNLAMTSSLCELYGQLGYISANVNYTLLIDEYKVFNIFRILDEITACIKSIKKELVKRGFNEDKLVLGIGGVSAGGHLALLYSYLIKNFNIIPIKFVINNVGPIGLHEEYFYKIKSHNETLDNIDSIPIIEQAKKDGKVIKLFPDSQILFFMNAFWGNKYTKEELNSILDENGNINYENEKYKGMYKVVKYGYITEIEDKHHLPTICVYGGVDDEIGVSTFAYLKEKLEKDGRHYDYIYSRYEGHILFFPTTEDGNQAVLNISSLVTQYFNEYFH